MYGFISGITETNEISYCPKCGGESVDTGQTVRQIATVAVIILVLSSVRIQRR